MRLNFFNPSTGDKLHITSYTSRGDGKYYDKWGKELLGDDGTPLKLIPKDGPITAPTILGSTAERNEKQRNYFKQRAKAHAQSDEGKHLREKATDKQMDNMGYEKK